MIKFRKRISYNFLLAVSLLVAASAVSVSCQRIRQGGRSTISFRASASAPDTKAIYSGETETTGGATYERINWEVGDVLRIYSDKAKDRYEDKYFSDYLIWNAPTNSGRISSAQLTNIGIPNPESDPGVPDPSADDDLNGLVWGDPDTYAFYAIYPAPTVDDPDGSSGKFVRTIPADQTTSLDDNQRAFGFLTAYTSVTTTSQGFGPSGSVDLEFVPRYTAFKISVGRGGQLEHDAPLLAVHASRQ